MTNKWQNNSLRKFENLFEVSELGKDNVVVLQKQTALHSYIKDLTSYSIELS